MENFSYYRGYISCDRGVYNLLQKLEAKGLAYGDISFRKSTCRDSNLSNGFYISEKFDKFLNFSSGDAYTPNYVSLNRGERQMLNKERVANAATKVCSKYNLTSCHWNRLANNKKVYLGEIPTEKEYKKAFAEIIFDSYNDRILLEITDSKNKTISFSAI